MLLLRLYRKSTFIGIYSEKSEVIQKLVKKLNTKLFVVVS